MDSIASNDSAALLSKIDQSLHNSGLGKGERQAEIVRLLLCRIWLARHEHLVKSVEKIPLKALLTRALLEVSKEIQGIETGSFQLSEASLQAVWNHFETLVIDSSRNSWAQDIFMKFGPQFLRKDLDQYFTPLEVADFICTVLALKPGDRVIDPAGGSGDFLSSANRALRLKNTSNSSLSLHYWDQSSEASQIAQLNLWLTDAVAEMTVHDSIQKSSEGAGRFDFCITNPPFGTKTVWESPRALEDLASYDLAHRWTKAGKTDEILRQQLGILFIERGLKLLRNGGALAIVLPSGYLSNPSEKYIREWLLRNHTILGVISLPSGTFKKSGAGVTPDILLVQKGSSAADYEIFMGQAQSIGFDYKKQDTPKIYKRDARTGHFATSADGSLEPDNDLLRIERQIANFAFQLGIDCLAQQQSEEEFTSISRDAVLRSKEMILSPKRYSAEYLETISRLQDMETFTLAEIGAEVTNSEKIEKTLSEEYVYLDIGEIGKCTYSLNNKLRGWQLPDRAKQTVQAGDILVSRLAGSVGKFCMIGEVRSKIVATNGLWRVRISDESYRFAFLHFLFSQDYAIQIQALATGSIMEDIKEEDFLEVVRIPKNPPKSSMAALRVFVASQSQLFELI